MSSLGNCFKVGSLFHKLRLRPRKEASENQEKEDEGTPSPPCVKPEWSSLNNGTDSSADRAQHPPPPKIALRQATLAQASTSQNGQQVTPSSANSLAAPPVQRRNSSSSSLSHEDNTLRHRASNSGSANGSSTDNSLKEQLRRGRRECPRRAHSFFVPKNTLEELITVPVVERDILARNGDIHEGTAHEYAEHACLYAKQLYAVLAYVKKGPDIFSLLNEEVADRALPLTRKADDQGIFALFRKTDEPGKTNLIPIPTFEKWSEKEREKFDRVQWWMTAPVFEEKAHYDLDEKAILPFVRFVHSEEMKKPMQGGYSEVYPVRVHPAHHDFWETGPEAHEPLVAIKKLFSPEESEFEKERTILKTLGSKASPHPHLIKLLASYRHKGKYHLMFPYANANLRKYWEDRTSPNFDEPTVLWSVKQMTGIADALYQIHTFSVTIPLNVAGPGGKRVHKDVEMSVRPGEELYGRHGDIKPENILWFQKTPECPDENGILQIADFGLGRFHGRDSRSKVNPDTVLTSPTYEPPECKLRRPVSRAYDLWSMGCLYLEFITWLLKGSAEIDNFADFRGKLSSTGINDDNFFTITRDPITGPEAAVRDNVVNWVNDLHQHEKCSALIHDLLDLIMSNLLLIDSKSRCEANVLFQQMKMYLTLAQNDREYMLKPVSQAQKRSSGGRSKSASNILGPPKTIPKRNPSATQGTILPLPVTPRSPILKPGGAPKKGKSVTWPNTKPTHEEG